MIIKTVLDIISFPKSHNVTPFELKQGNYHIFDLTNANTQLRDVDFNHRDQFNNYIFQTLKDEGKEFGIGRYNEDRVIYQSDVFKDKESRSVHLGIDIWAPAGTPVFAPYDGIIHSFANNSAHGDYGPTVILEHNFEGQTFHTLYGHLAKTDLVDLAIGREIKAGELFAHYGTYEENVHYPPHLHFQLIMDIGNHKGDFPGVCKPSERDEWLTLCPDPNLILQIPGLE